MEKETKLVYQNIIWFGNDLVTKKFLSPCCEADESSPYGGYESPSAFTVGRVTPMTTILMRLRRRRAESVN